MKKVRAEEATAHLTPRGEGELWQPSRMLATRRDEPNGERALSGWRAVAHAAMTGTLKPK